MALRKSEDELNEVAKGILSGDVLTSQSVPKRLMHHVFGPLFFAGQDVVELNEAWLIYEYVSKANHARINEFPVFNTLNTLNRDEYMYVMEKCLQIKNEFQTESISG